jgi:hypothetical protein
MSEHHATLAMLANPFSKAGHHLWMVTHHGAPLIADNQLGRFLSKVLYHVYWAPQGQWSAGRDTYEGKPVVAVRYKEFDGSHLTFDVGPFWAELYYG